MNSMLLFVMVIIFQLNEIDSADSPCQSCPQNLTASNHLIAGSELGRFAFSYSNDSSNNCLQANIICGFFIKKPDQQQVAEIFVNDIDNVLYQINGFTETESAAEFVCDNNNHWIYYYSATNQFRIHENSIQCVIVTSSAVDNRILIGDANNATVVAKKIVSPKFVAHDDGGHRSHHHLHHRHRQLPKSEQKHHGWGYGWGYGRDLSDGGYRSYANRRYNINGFGYSASGDSRADENRIDNDESNSDDDDQQRRDDKGYVVIDSPRVERKSSNSHDDDQLIQIVLKSDELSSASASSELRSSSNSIQQQSSSSSGSDSHRFSSKSSSSASIDRSCRFTSKSSSAECKNKNKSSAPQIVSNCLQSTSLEKSIIRKAICQRRFRLFAKMRKHPLYSLA